jgi:phosphoglycerate dehydrogenase-like enzyme
VNRGEADQELLPVSEALPRRLAELTRARLDDAFGISFSFHSWREVAADGGVLVIAPHELARPERTRALNAAHWSWVHLTSAGSDFVDLADWPRGTLLTRSWQCYAAPLAEYVLHAVLTHEWRGHSPWQAAGRRPADRTQPAPSPVPPGRGSAAGPGLHGARIGIAGWGAVGRTAGHLLATLGAHVTALSRRPGRRDDGSIIHTTSLDHILDVDHLVVALPLTPATDGLFGRDVLGRARPGMHFINVSRGRIVDQEALAARCAAGQMFATLDVTEPEPLPGDHPLRALPTVRISPHIAWRSRDSDGAFIDDFIRIWQALANGDDTPGVVAATNSERARRAITGRFPGGRAVPRPGRPPPPPQDPPGRPRDAPPDAFGPRSAAGSRQASGP